MRNFKRADRVQQQVQRLLSEIIQKDIHDPRLNMLTITGVKMSDDLKLARIFFVPGAGARSRREVEAGLASCAGYIKKLLSPRIGTRYMPDLIFQYDESFDYGSRMDHVLDQLNAGNEQHHSPSESQ